MFSYKGGNYIKGGVSQSFLSLVQEILKRMWTKIRTKIRTKRTII